MIAHGHDLGGTNLMIIMSAGRAKGAMRRSPGARMLPAGTAPAQGDAPPGRDCPPVITHNRRIIMQWTTPQFSDLRFGFEVTMYIANR